MFDVRCQRASVGMPSEDPVRALLDDLEMQADGLHLAERAVEVGELSVAEYAEVTLAARLHGSIGCSLRVGLVEGLELRGRLARVGSDWALLDDGQGSAWLVPLGSLAVIAGLGARSVPAEARSLSARLSLRSVLRRLVEEVQPGALHLRGGRILHGVLVRVGADFVEVRQSDPGDVATVPLAALTVVQVRSGAGS